jgi:hypothetical protein
MLLHYDAQNQSHEKFQPYVLSVEISGNQWKVNSLDHHPLKVRLGIFHA